jgi:hypothetical protein
VRPRGPFRDESYCKYHSRDRQFVDGIAVPFADRGCDARALASLFGSGSAHIARAGRVAEWLKAPVLKTTFEHSGPSQ